MAHVPLLPAAHGSWPPHSPPWGVVVPHPGELRCPPAFTGPTFLTLTDGIRCRKTKVSPQVYKAQRSHAEFVQNRDVAPASKPPAQATCGLTGSRRRASAWGPQASLPVAQPACPLSPPRPSAEPGGRPAPRACCHLRLHVSCQRCSCCLEVSSAFRLPRGFWT